MPHYDFNWQLTYELAQPKLSAQGHCDRLRRALRQFGRTISFNPDPTKEVHYGEQTWEEMMFGFFDVSVPMNMTAMDLMMPKKAPAQATSGGGF